jgi:hypothetical protein
MDFLLVVLALGGFVFAVVMLVLASRTTRMQRESDARVQTLEALATGSVLFASDRLVTLDEAPEPEMEGPAWDELAPERAEAPASHELVYEREDALRYPFVMTVPAAAQGRGFSFERSQRGRSK